MGILDRIGKLFGNNKPTLKSLSVDDLKREHIAVESEWNKLITESENSVRDDAQLKEEYKTAHTAGKLSLKRVIAQKLQNLELARKGIETRLANTSRELQTLAGLLAIKEIVRKENSEIGLRIAQMDIGEIERFVLDATVEGTLRQDKLEAALLAVSEGVDSLALSSGSTKINDYMDELDAELLGTPNTEMGEIDALHESLDAVAEKGLNTVRQLRQTTQTSEQETIQ